MRVVEGSDFNGPLSDFLWWFWWSSLQPEDEFLILPFILWVTVVPQIMAYVIGGPVGCAARPWFVDWVLTILSWAIIKALAVAGGLEIAHGLYLMFWYDGGAIGIGNYYPGHIGDGLFKLFLSLTIMAMYFEGSRILARGLEKLTTGRFKQVHEFATRYRTEPGPDPIEDGKAAIHVALRAFEEIQTLRQANTDK